MRELTAIAILALSLGACAGGAGIKAAAMRDDDEACRSMGFKLGSHRYDHCRAERSRVRAERDAEAAATPNAPSSWLSNDSHKSLLDQSQSNSTIGGPGTRSGPFPAVFSSGSTGLALPLGSTGGPGPAIDLSTGHVGFAVPLN